MRTIHKVRLPRLHLHPNNNFSLVYRYLCSRLFHSLIRFSIFYARTGIESVSVYSRVSSLLSLLLMPFEQRALVLTVCAMRRRGLLSGFRFDFGFFFFKTRNTIYHSSMREVFRNQRGGKKIIFFIIIY